MVSCTPKRDGTAKDTLRNVLETREFVVNSVHESFVRAMNQSAAEYPYGVDEMSKVGLTPAEGAAELRQLGAYVTVDPGQLALR